MNEISQKIMDAMFTQQRLQVLSLGVHHNEFSDAYLFAWYEGVYPFFEDTDGSVQRRPHEHYAEHFSISEQKVDELTKYLDDCFLNDDVPTFYELEDHFNVRHGGTKWDRSDLINICRYCYLQGHSWNEAFWTKLLTPMQHPSEASSIVRKLDREADIYFQ